MERFLDEVVTLAEAARITHRDPKDIRYRIELGQLHWRKAGKTVLITTESLERVFGPVAWPQFEDFPVLVEVRPVRSRKSMLEPA